MEEKKYKSIHIYLSDEQKIEMRARALVQTQRSTYSKDVKQFYFQMKHSSHFYRYDWNNIFLYNVT